MDTKTKTIIIIVIILIITVFVGGYFLFMNKKKSTVLPQPPVQKQNNNSQIANPASVFCEQNGGKLEIRTGSDGGQVGYCVFPDGSECEEWAYQRGECKPGDSLKSASDISNWQTYRNKKYGFEFRYPKDWESSSPNSDNNFGGNTNIGTVFKKGVNQVSNNGTDRPDTNPVAAIYMNLVDNPKNLSIQELFNERNDQCLADEKKSLIETGVGGMGCPGAENVSNWKNILVDGKPALRSGMRPVPEGVPVDEVYITLQNKYLVLSAPSVIDNRGEIVINVGPVFDQILSTFKFIAP